MTDPIEPTGPAYTERRQSVLSAVSMSRSYLIAAIVLSVVTVVAVLVVLVAQIMAGQPLQTGGLYVLISVTAPIVVALLGAAGIGVLQVLDGHQAQLMRAVGEKEHAKGIIEGLKENPNTNIS